MENSDSPTSSLDANTADKLLDLLSNDDSYRELFSKDPATALASIGYKHPSDQPYPEVVDLASKDKIAEARDTLKRHLVSLDGLVIIFFLDGSRKN